MKWYRYNPDTLEYEHPVICQPNPARPGEFLIPPSATELKPPSTKKHEIQVFQPESKTWILKPNYRGTEYWLPDGSHHKIEQFEEVPPENALDKQPPPTPEEQFQEMKWQRNRMLNDSDWIALRHEDQVKTGLSTALSDTVFKAFLKWRQQLRNMPETFSQSKTTQPRWAWPPIPPELKPDFPDYPPNLTGSFSNTL